MISSILLGVFLLGFTLSVGFWLTEIYSFKKMRPYILFSLLCFITLIFIPKSSSHLELYDGKKDSVIIEVPEGYKVTLYQVISDSKWFWTDRDGAIVYKVEEK